MNPYIYTPALYVTLLKLTNASRARIALSLLSTYYHAKHFQCMYNGLPDNDYCLYGVINHITLMTGELLMTKMDKIHTIHHILCMPLAIGHFNLSSEVDKVWGTFCSCVAITNVFSEIRIIYKNKYTRFMYEYIYVFVKLAAMGGNIYTYLTKRDQLTYPFAYLAVYPTLPIYILQLYVIKKLMTRR